MDIHCTCYVAVFSRNAYPCIYKNEDKVHREIPGRHITMIELQGCHFIRVHFAMKICINQVVQKLCNNYKYLVLICTSFNDITIEIDTQTSNVFWHKYK